MPDLFVGVDPSLSDTGFAVIDSDDDIIDLMSIKTTSKTLDLTRCREITDIIYNRVATYSEDHTVRVFIEAIPFSRNPNGKLFTRHELVGILKYRLTSFGIDTYMIGATTLKNKFTGYGQSDKDAIKRAIYTRYGRVIKNDNVADGLALAGLGSDYIHRKVKLSIEKMPMK